jgi:hypothetical protein
VALLALRQFTEVGSQPTWPAVTASDTVTAVPGLGLIVRNTTGTVDNVTILSKTFGPGGNATPNVVVVVPATTGFQFIALTNPEYVDPLTGLITIQHSNVAAGVTCELVRIG